MSVVGQAERQSGVRREETGLSEDELFDILSNGRRRYALDALIGESEATDVGTLAERVAARENGVALGELSSQQRKRVYTALQQSHLPKMEGAGLVAFDKDRGTVEPAERLDDVELYLEVVREKDAPWSRYYLGLSGGCLALALAVTAGVAPFAALPGEVWLMFVVVAFVVSSAVHAYRTGSRRLGTDGRPAELRS